MTFSLAILCALEIEGIPIINSLDMTERPDVFDKRLRLRFFVSGKFPEICLVLFNKCPLNNVDRIGTQIAALSTWETIKTISPKVIASVGTAGGFKAKGAKIGDVYMSDGPIFFHGRHIPVPEYQSFELGKFPSMSMTINSNIKKGIISSSDSIPVSQHDEEKMNLIKPDAKDMEAAAVAEVAHMAGIPMFALKAISDFVDSTERTHRQFLSNYKVATKNLTESLELLITNKSFG